MTLDPAYRTVIQGIVNSVPMTNRREALPVGTHEVAICRYQAVAGINNSGYRLESTWLILSSDQPTVPPGTIRDWTWFPQAQGFRGQYEADRAHSLLSVGCEGLGSSEMDDQIGDKLATGEYRGMRWRVLVTPVLNDDGSQRMTRPKGNAKPRPIRNAEWFPVRQSLADMQQLKAYIEQSFATACKNAEPRPFQQAPHPAQMAGQYPAQLAQLAQQAQPQFAQPQFTPYPPQQPAPGAPQLAQQPVQPAQQPQQPAWPQQPQPQFQAPPMPANIMPAPQGPQAMPQLGAPGQVPAPQGSPFGAAPQGSPFGAAPALNALGPLMNQLRQQ